MREMKLINYRGQAIMADSREVAANFGKNHRDVTRTIDELIEGLRKTSQTPKGIFTSSTYIHEQNGQTYRNYLMTRDGFQLLVMGFTGPEAIQWKLAYIRAFDEMERRLTAKPMTSAEILFQQSKLLVEQEKRIAAVEQTQQKMIDVFTPAPEVNWQESVNQKINHLIAHNGLEYRNYKRELYMRLEATARCDINSRLTNLKKRMKEQGCKQTDIDAATKLRVIADDPKLRAIFDSIVRTEEAKHIMPAAGL